MREEKRRIKRKKLDDYDISLEKKLEKKKAEKKIKKQSADYEEDYEKITETREERRKNKRKISAHKLFNILSFIFIISCILFYGVRFIKLYKENNKTEETKQIADNIKDDNSSNENFKNVKGDYYFYGSEVNNYLKYSNLLWRIIKVDSHGNVIVSLDTNITSLAKLTNEYNESIIYKWLNKTDEENTGIFQNILNDTPQYLTYTETCIDKVDDTKNITCKNQTKETYITIPSLNDYINTGSSKSFLNSGSYYYLINNGTNKTWCIDSEGKLSTSNGEDIIGVKPVITIKNLVKLKSGNGTKETPYELEEENPSLIGSYVKIDNDIWQVYSENENSVQLVLDSYLKINENEIENRYSRLGYEYNAKEYGSLAYYLNNKYLNSLKYKNILLDFEISNGIFTKYDYKEAIKTKVNTKIGILSIGDIMVNEENADYFLSTGSVADNSLMYTYQGNSKINTKKNNTMLKIIPTISIEKSKITAGGTKENPSEVVYE